MGPVNITEETKLIIYACPRMLHEKYLLLQLLSELFGLVLLIVVHNHHGSIDLPNGHVTG